MKNTLKEFLELSPVERTEFLNCKDLQYPNRELFTTYTVKNIDTLEVETKDITKAKLKEMGLYFSSKKLVQQDKFIVELFFNEDAYKEAKMIFNIESTRRDNIFHEYLRYDNDIKDDKLHKIIYSRAYEDSHSGGYFEIENTYSELVDFYNQLKAQGV